MGFSLWGPEDGEIILRTYEDDLLVELKVIRIHQDIECLAIHPVAVRILHSEYQRESAG